MPVESQAGFEPEIVVLYCQSVFVRGADFESAVRRARGLRLRPVALPCTSKIEIGHLLGILEQGADGIEILGCAGERCEFLNATVRIQRRVERARALLGHTSLGGERLWLDLGETFTTEQALALAAARAEEVRALGPNPLKKESR